MGTQQATSTPTLSKIALGQLIQKIRERAGLTRLAVAELMGVDAETIRRWERGKFAPKKHVLESLAVKIGARPDELSRMQSLSLSSNGRGLFEGNNVPPLLRAFYESEAVAEGLCSVGLLYLPGLLQTRAYHRTAQDAQVPIDAQHAEDLRELRTRRQEITFGRSPLPRMDFILSRASLLLLDDYPDIKDEQVGRLLEVAAMPGVEMRVSTGFHASMLNAFTIVTPPQESGGKPFVYVEAIDGGRYVEGHVVSEYVAAAEASRTRQSVPIEEVLG
jgi:transcriptional regulator with XRE-family HTH domain